MRGNKGQAHSDRLYRAKNTYNIADGVNRASGWRVFCQDSKTGNKEGYQKT